MAASSPPPLPRSQHPLAEAAPEGADVAWLKESHDVIWQLNVELQMENERLGGENRRLRLKLRQMLQNGGQNGQHGGCGGSQNYHGNSNQCGGNCDDRCHADHGRGRGGPKVVQGRIKGRSKSKERSSMSGASMLAP